MNFDNNSAQIDHSDENSFINDLIAKAKFIFT